MHVGLMSNLWVRVLQMMIVFASSYHEISISIYSHVKSYIYLNFVLFNGILAFFLTFFGLFLITKQHTGTEAMIVLTTSPRAEGTHWYIKL